MTEETEKIFRKYLASAVALQIILILWLALLTVFSFSNESQIAKVERVLKAASQVKK